MIHKPVQNTVWFVSLVLLQVLILNRLHLFGYGTPFLYIYFIIRYDMGVSRNMLMILGFALGLTVDMFSNTAGVNAAATVFLAFIRPVLLRAFVTREMADISALSMQSMGVGVYLRYMIVAVLLHHIALFAILFFSFANLPFLLLKIAVSALLTFLCIIAIEWLRS